MMTTTERLPARPLSCYQSPMRILVAEDDAKLRSHLVSALQSAGHATDQTGDGEEALWLLGEHDYDAAVLDIMMPGKDGVSVTRAASDQPGLLGAALVGWTALGHFPTLAAAQAALAQGGDVFRPERTRLAREASHQRTPGSMMLASTAHHGIERPPSAKPCSAAMAASAADRASNDTNAKPRDLPVAGSCDMSIARMRPNGEKRARTSGSVTSTVCNPRSWLKKCNRLLHHLIKWSLLKY